MKTNLLLLGFVIITWRCAFFAISMDTMIETIQDRVDCSSGVGSPDGGPVHITASECVERGCVWNEKEGEPSCFYDAEGTPVSTVHMINSNHFDAGYADLTANVVNEYFDTYFLRAASVGKDLRTNETYRGRPGAGPLKWMTFSWLVSLYFECPPDMDLHCPNETARDVVRDAIEAGDIVWPAFPHNAEIATADASFLRFGVELSQTLEKQFAKNVTHSTVLSTRDVPGMPRSALPILKKAGVRALSEGMNGRIVPVNVPPAFVWSSLDNSVRMPTLWHWHGYGQLGEPGDPIRIPGTGHALAYCWRGDNAGPPMSAEEVLTNAERLASQYNVSNVRSSSLGEYVAAVDADDAWTNLPVILTDLSDTWIWGVGSDPVKVQRMRALARARTQCERRVVKANDDCGRDDADYRNFSRLALKNLEHTWGVSVFHYGNESDKDWGNAAFHAKLDAGEPHFEEMISSWIEQRAFGIDIPLSALDDTHDVRVAAEADFRDLEADVHPDPEAEGLKRVPILSSPVSIGENGDATVTFGNDASVVDFTTSSGHRVVSASHPLGRFRYQTLVKSDFDTWRAEYLIPGSGGENEYGKPDSFMNANPVKVLASPTLQDIWTGRSNGTTTVVLNATYDDNASPRLHEDYGAPSSIWIRYDFVSEEDGTWTIRCRLTLLNKTATRLPEASWFSFDTTSNATWQHAVLREWSSPLDVADGAARGLHYVSEDGVRRTDGSVQVESIDTGLLRWGSPLPFPTPIHGDANLTVGASFNLHNNVWNTNYPEWMPFDEIGRNLVFRFVVSIKIPGVY